MKRLLALTVLAVVFSTAVFAGGDPTSRQTRLYGTLTSITGDTLSNAKVTITLAGRNYFYTSTLSVSGGETVVYTDANGYFASTVWGTDSLFPSGWATYTIEAEHPELQKSGTSFNPTGLTITADGDSTDLRDVLAQ